MTTQSPDRPTFDKVIGRWMRAISTATWLSLAVLVVTITALVVASLLSIQTGKDVSEEFARKQLGSRGGLKADQVERYFGFVRQNVVELADGTELADDAVRFSQAYAQLDSVDADVIKTDADQVATFYRDDFAPELEAVLGTTVGWRSFMPTTDAAIYLQRNYVVVPDSPNLRPDERRLIDDADDGSQWSAVHRELHPRLLEITQRFGLGDLAIIEPSNGAVVYSTAKAPDFATSLDRGPYSGSTLASLVRSVREAPVRGVVSILDLAPYGPTVGRPVGFLGAPLYQGSRLVGILVVQITTDELDSITTADRDWQSQGFGDTGEAYVVGSDGRMRTISRAFVEDPVSYLDAVISTGATTESERKAMAGTGTTAVFQLAADTAELGSVEPIDRTNYLGQAVISSFRPLEIEGLDWTMVSEIAGAEVQSPLDDFRNATLIAVSIFVILIAFATVVWASRVFRPLRVMSEKLRRLHAGETTHELEAAQAGPVEFAELAGNIDDMLLALRTREVELAAATQQRLETLRSLLPPGIAQRVEAGDREVLDQIPQAGVVVLVPDDLGKLARIQSGDGHRGALERIVEELDSIAAQHGLERVKIVGDAYFAVCGLTQPYLDHAPRSVAFALDARDAYREIGREIGHDIDLSAGIHVGSVTLGLAGSARLVYDAWGDAVATAHFLARAAPPGVILASDEAKILLPEEIAVTRWNEDAAPPIWRISSQRISEEVSA